MTGYYAVGGGLGHLTRGRRVLDALGIDAAFVTASPYADDPRVTGGRAVVRVPASLESDVDAHRDWLREQRFERLIVDTFPCGIQGELSGLDVPMDLVARRMRWEAYRHAVPYALPRFDVVWAVEELEQGEALALRAVIRSLRLPIGGHSGVAEDFWLIVHSGPEEEVRELVEFARELMRIHRAPRRTLVATRCTLALPPRFERIDAYPVAHLYPRAERIFSAAGFNVMLETEPFRDRHHVVPFARAFDDQFARAAARKRFGASVVTM